MTVPRTLPCGHYYCVKCARKVISNTKIQGCGQCLQPCVIKDCSVNIPLKKIVGHVTRIRQIVTRLEELKKDALRKAQAASGRKRPFSLEAESSSDGGLHLGAGMPQFHTVEARSASSSNTPVPGPTVRTSSTAGPPADEDRESKATGTPDEYEGVFATSLRPVAAAAASGMHSTESSGAGASGAGATRCTGCSSGGGVGSASGSLSTQGTQATQGFTYHTGETPIDQVKKRRREESTRLEAEAAMLQQGQSTAGPGAALHRALVGAATASAPPQLGGTAPVPLANRRQSLANVQSPPVAPMPAVLPLVKSTSKQGPCPAGAVHPSHEQEEKCAGASSIVETQPVVTHAQASADDTEDEDDDIYDFKRRALTTTHHPSRPAGASLLAAPAPIPAQGLTAASEETRGAPGVSQVVQASAQRQVSEDCQAEAGSTRASGGATTSAAMHVDEDATQYDGGASSLSPVLHMPRSTLQSNPHSNTVRHTSPGPASESGLGSGAGGGVGSTGMPSAHSTGAGGQNQAEQIEEGDDGSQSSHPPPGTSAVPPDLSIAGCSTQQSAVLGQDPPPPPEPMSQPAPVMVGAAARGASTHSVVACCSVLTIEQRNTVRSALEVCSRQGWSTSMVDAFDASRVTHVVTAVEPVPASMVAQAQKLGTSFYAKRTLKVLEGIVTGCWVVGPSWSTAVLQAGQYVAEEDHEVRAITKNDANWVAAPTRMRVAGSNGRVSPFLHGHHVALLTPLAEMKVNEMLELLKAGRATVAEVPYSAEELGKAYMQGGLAGALTYLKDLPEHALLLTSFRHVMHYPGVAAALAALFPPRKVREVCDSTAAFPLSAEPSRVLTPPCRIVVDQLWLLDSISRAVLLDYAFFSTPGHMFVAEEKKVAQVHGPGQGQWAAGGQGGGSSAGASRVQVGGSGGTGVAGHAGGQRGTLKNNISSNTPMQAVHTKPAALGTGGSLSLAAHAKYGPGPGPGLLPRTGTASNVQQQGTGAGKMTSTAQPRQAYGWS